MQWSLTDTVSWFQLEAFQTLTSVWPWSVHTILSSGCARRIWTLINIWKESVVLGRILSQQTLVSKWKDAEAARQQALSSSKPFWLVGKLNISCQTFVHYLYRITLAHHLLFQNLYTIWNNRFHLHRTETAWSPCVMLRIAKWCWCHNACHNTSFRSFLANTVPKSLWFCL